ncbi:hypothetical protein NHG32_01990 [Aerococcaceae bacterium NML191219]|nr:hypothetical protein [Aerococcaceae bacterium NML191219]
MIYKFWRNGDFLDTINFLRLNNGNIDEMDYPGYKKGWFNYAFNEGKCIDTTLIPDFKFYYDAKEGDVFTEVLLNVHSLLIVSKAVKQVFDENDVKYLQYIPIEIEELNTGITNTDYYIVNCLQRIDGINLEHSRYDHLEEYDMYTFWGNQICFNKDKVESLDVFKDVKAPNSIFVSEKIKNIFKENNWQTMNFTPMDVL